MRSRYSVFRQVETKSFMSHSSFNEGLSCWAKQLKSGKATIDTLAEKLSNSGCEFTLRQLKTLMNLSVVAAERREISA